MRDPLRVAVIGVGQHGKNHARILSDLAHVKLAAVVDINAERAEAIAKENRTRSVVDFMKILHEVDAVTIAVPTVAHHDIALAFLGAGVPVLVEKPMARTVLEAQEMIQAGAHAGVPLAVGHTERFNPAVVAARPLITDPRFIEVHRLGDFSKRSLDIDVVFDLMIHDLDILMSIVKHSVESVEAVGVSVMSDRVDIANARLRFSNGCVANLTASRITVGDRDKLVRKIRFFQPAAYLSIDYKERTVEYLQRVKDHNGDAAIRSAQVDVSVDEEPLRRELADFVDAVRHNRTPTVSGEDGLLALQLAERISRQIEATAGVA